MPLFPRHHLDDLLAADPLIASRTAEGVIEGLGRAYGVRKAEFASSDAPFCALANRVQMADVSLHYCRYDTPADIVFADMPGFRQFFCLKGGGRVRVAGRSMEIGPSHTGIVSPGSTFEAEYGGGYSHLVVQFTEDALLHKLALLEGRDMPAALEFPLFETLDAGAVWRLRDISICLAALFNEPVSKDAVAATELEQALISTFLMESRRALGIRAAPAKDVSNATVARLEDYIHAHRDRPLTIEDVAEACGVSVRSVFAQFKRAKGMSPHAYIRQVRLKFAREELLAGGQASVIDVAIRCGFSSLGHFARRYREAFGELPSATLGRGRRGGRPH